MKTVSEHSSVRKAQVHFGLCGSQGVMLWVSCQRMPSTWMRITLWNVSVMGSLPPSRITPGKVQCLVSVRAQLPQELCAVFWTSCYMCPQQWHMSPKAVPTPSLPPCQELLELQTGLYLCKAVKLTSVANTPSFVTSSKWSRTGFGWQSSRGDVHAATFDGTGWLSKACFKRT